MGWGARAGSCSSVCVLLRCRAQNKHRDVLLQKIVDRSGVPWETGVDPDTVSRVWLGRIKPDGGSSHFGACSARVRRGVRACMGGPVGPEPSHGGRHARRPRACPAPAGALPSLSLPAPLPAARLARTIPAGPCPATSGSIASPHSAAAAVVVSLPAGLQLDMEMDMVEEGDEYECVESADGSMRRVRRSTTHGTGLSHGMSRELAAATEALAAAAAEEAAAAAAAAEKEAGSDAQGLPQAPAAANGHGAAPPPPQQHAAPHQNGVAGHLHPQQKPPPQAPPLGAGGAAAGMQVPTIIGPAAAAEAVAS